MWLFNIEKCESGKQPLALSLQVFFTSVVLCADTVQMLDLLTYIGLFMYINI